MQFIRDSYCNQIYFKKSAVKLFIKLSSRIKKLNSFIKISTANIYNILKKVTILQPIVLQC